MFRSATTPLTAASARAPTPSSRSRRSARGSSRSGRASAGRDSRAGSRSPTPARALVISLRASSGFVVTSLIVNVSVARSLSMSSRDSFRAILIDDHRRHVVDGLIDEAEQQHLHDRHHHGDDQHAAVAPDMQELLSRTPRGTTATARRSRCRRRNRRASCGTSVRAFGGRLLGQRHEHVLERRRDRADVNLAELCRASAASAISSSETARSTTA